MFLNGAKWVRFGAILGHKILAGAGIGTGKNPSEKKKNLNPFPLNSPPKNSP